MTIVIDAQAAIGFGLLAAAIFLFGVGVGMVVGWVSRGDPQ